MPRIYQNEDRYLVEDFQKELRRKQGEYNLMSIRALAGETGIPQSTLNPKIHDPGKLLLSELRKLIRTLHPEIGVILALLGYSRQEIKKFKEAAHGKPREENV